MSTIAIVAILKARKGFEQQLRELLLAVVPPSRAEEGCLSYVLHENPEDPNEFVFYETWKDEAALQDHLASSHYKNYRQSAEAWLEQREVYRVNPLAIQ
ncbi:antibiotic biosynthesis monooxygenase [Paenibacillus glycanilyticus]|uniref:putative quinol monooxygenase n=1 Tax=Paenibacillus glycanilyticus TaxID=126569 RepID=UPI00203FD3C7|nr:putative quinol monooxygenase [Paenibacillus glycanilyticus]MCM3629893.1 antibiotic biosynthesis monooxygenase [Paenibacillus glycanilyticus]